MWVGCPPPPAEPDCCDVPSSAAACSFFSDAEPPFSPSSFCAVSDPHALTNISDTATNNSEKDPATLRIISLLPPIPVKTPRSSCVPLQAGWFSARGHDTSAQGYATLLLRAAETETRETRSF